VFSDGHNGGLLLPSPRALFYIKLLKDPNPNVRKKSAQAIGQIGDKSCLLRLKSALASEQDAEVQKAIQEVIAKLKSSMSSFP